MRDPRSQIEELVERLVRASDVADPRAREELRRELASHFDESGDSPEALRDALARFGSAEVVGRGFRAAYRRGRGALYAAKVLASVVAATSVAVVLELVANLRVSHDGRAGLGIGHGFPISVGFALAIVILVVAAWELDIEPLCARLERRPMRLLGAFAAVFATIYFGHPLVHGPIDAPLGLVIAASATGVAVWACTIAIVARLDLAFLRLLAPPH